MDATAIKAFASSFDPQPFHLDDEAARATFFGGLAASGWHTAAVTIRCSSRARCDLGGIIAARNEGLAWPRAVRPGDTLEVESEVLEVRPSGSEVAPDGAAREREAAERAPRLVVRPALLVRWAECERSQVLLEQLVRVAVSVARSDQIGTDPYKWDVDWVTFPPPRDPPEIPGWLQHQDHEP